MSDNSLIGGIPLVTVDDAIEFFSERTPQPCPACGAMKWGVYTTAPAAGDPNTSVVLNLIGAEVPTGHGHNSGMPLVLVTCKKCAFIRMHAMVQIARWIEEGKPDYTDEDENEG